MVVVDRLTKSTHFIPFRVGQSTELLANKYMREVVRLHGVLASIMSDRDARFKIAFLGEPPGKFENLSKVQHILSSRYRRTVRTNNTDP